MSGAPMEKKFKALNQSVTVQIQQVLHDQERLLKRTQLNRAEVVPLGKVNQLFPVFLFFLTFFFKGKLGRHC
jgi:hypothetical protein